MAGTAQGPGTAQRRRILVVDDEPVSRFTLAGVLKRRFEVVESGTGEDAVERALAGDVDVVLMDINLPGMNGYEATRIIKRALGERFLPVVFMTASNDEASLAEGLQAGGDDFLTKPISRLLLESKIDALLRVGDVFRSMKAQKDQLSYFRERANRDYALAKRVFDNIGGRSARVMSALDVHVLPMETFSGDLVLAAPLGPDRLRLMVGDFAGHGLPAAVGALPISDIFHATTERGLPLDSVIREMNAKVYRILPRDMFLAALVADFDGSTGRLAIWNGGLPEGLIVSAAGEVRSVIESRHLPLGVLSPDVMDPGVAVYKLHAGERLLVYTDGLVEASDPEREMFGIDRVHAALRSTGGTRRWAKRLVEEVESFRRGAGQSDDITVLGLTYDEDFRKGLALAEAHERRAGGRQLCYERVLDPAGLREADPLAPFLRVIEETTSLRGSSSALFTVLCELFSNTLEHGLLNLRSGIKSSPEGFAEYYRLRERALAALDQGWIRVTLEVAAGAEGPEARITVEDSGSGFEVPRLETEAPVHSKPRGHGLGLSLVKGLCREIRFLDGGRIVEAAVALPPSERRM